MKNLLLLYFISGYVLWEFSLFFKKNILWWEGYVKVTSPDVQPCDSLGITEVHSQFVATPRVTVEEGNQIGRVDSDVFPWAA